MKSKLEVCLFGEINFSNQLCRYSHANHPTRINYYSTPDATVKVNGQPVGEAGQSDNRLVIETSAVTFQNIGDESGVCPAEGKYREGQNGVYTEKLVLL